MSLHRTDWLRPIEDWLPTSQNLHQQFSSIAQHLFARFPVPEFMTSVWLEMPPGEKLAQHEWYKHLGLGRNIRTANLPLRFTRAMAHLFSEAPHHLSAIAAIRWAQVLGLGGDETLARAIIGTRLGKFLVNEDFWESVLHFFVNNPSIDRAHVGPVVEFLQHQRYEWKEGVSSEGVFGKLPPPRPDFPSLFDESYWSPELGVTHPKSTANQVRLAIDCLTRLASNQRVFLFLNLSALHQPNYFYLSGAMEDSITTHRAALRYVDREIAPLFGALEHRGSGFGILCSDHGTAYGEDGYHGHRLAHPVVWDVPYAEFAWEHRP